MIATIKKDHCCSYEYPAALAQCSAMAEDGILMDTDLVTCAEMVTNYNCGTPNEYDESCAKFPKGWDKSDLEYIWSVLEKYAKDNNSTIGIASTCNEAVNNMDARVQKQKNSLPQVCTPACETKYINTIGNNACMIGQCVEESFERHRLIPGRMALYAQDEAFPWDSRSAKDPNNGEFLVTAPQMSLPLPPYRPEFLARQMDNFLCQANGLPTKTPPILCSFDPVRRLSLPTQNFLPFVQSLLDQPSEQSYSRDFMENVAPGIGTRIGMQVYKQYLGPALGTLEELILSASDLLKNLEDVKFPNEMCKRNNFGSS